MTFAVDMRRSRRGFLLALCAGTATMTMFALGRPAAADLAAVQKALAQVLGERKPQEGRVQLDVPEIAENGNMVPVTVAVDSPMTETDYVKAVYVFADGNPRPEVATFHFSPVNGEAVASTRVRLAKTQTVYAIAEMSDGSLFMATREVKVTIGGCGG